MFFLEDNDLVVIDKPAGLLFIRGWSSATHFGQRIAQSLRNLSGMEEKNARESFIASIRKRAAVWLSPKRPGASRFIEAICRARGRKVYLALVAGKLRKTTGVIEEKMGDIPASAANRDVIARTLSQELNTASFVRKIRLAWSSADCIADAPTKFAFTFTTSVTRCWEIKSMRHARRNIFRDTCSTPGNSDFDIQAPAHGKAFKRLCRMILRP
jgi:hypothetical protein